MTSIAVPRHFAGGRQVIKARQLRALHDLLNGQRRHVGNQICAGRSANLVGDDAQGVSILGQAQHGLGKIIAASAIDPAGAEDQVLAA
ncbi:hypothetical protein D3C81_1830380 [compost metagenome]